MGLAGLLGFSGNPRIGLLSFDAFTTSEKYWCDLVSSGLLDLSMSLSMFCVAGSFECSCEADNFDLLEIPSLSLRKLGRLFLSYDEEDMALPSAV